MRHGLTRGGGCARGAGRARCSYTSDARAAAIHTRLTPPPHLLACSECSVCLSIVLFSLFVFFWLPFESLVAPCRSIPRATGPHACRATTSLSVGPTLCDIGARDEGRVLFSRWPCCRSLSRPRASVCRSTRSAARRRRRCTDESAASGDRPQSPACSQYSRRVPSG